MARVDDLIAQVSADSLRSQLAEAVRDLRRRKKFGLVFEEHIPETVLLASSAGVRPGMEVMLRKEPADKTRYVVEKIFAKKATISDGAISRSVMKSDLLVVVPFGEPVYPVLKPAGPPLIQSPSRPNHAVINGENFHALQLLKFALAGQVDCIYIDPPYNTGARDWRYNNDYVDEGDAFRHSKWLSFMEKRLRIAADLLKPDGVLIVTIDEHEVHHLGVLLSECFPGTYQQSVTIVITARGVAKQGLARVEEYAIYTYLGSASANSTSDDFLTGEKKPRNPWASLLRRGTGASPSERAGLVYPILVHPDSKKIVGVGETLDETLRNGSLTKDELDAYDPPRTPSEAWPIRSDGSLGRWQVKPSTLMEIHSKGFVKLGKYNERRRSWSVNYLKAGPLKEIADGTLIITGYEWDGGPAILKYVEADGDDAGRRAKTVWRRVAHDAGTYGSSLLRDLLGARIFDFPKSLYAVHDTLSTVVGDKRDALILDFFAGSGTTLHATALLNAEDDGMRRCILVTNNDVDVETTASLHSQGLFQGDPKFEARGIFEGVAKPRVFATLTGRRTNGSDVPGEYLPEYLPDRTFSEGLDDNAVFYELAYSNPASIEVGDRFEDVLPLLWLAAGGHGDPSGLKQPTDWLLAEDARFAVLLNEDRVSDFIKQVENAPELTHVWLVTDSDAAFARMRTLLSGELKVGQLYRDYLQNFRINAGVAR